jgi:N-methylhydantoinase A
LTEADVEGIGERFEAAYEQLYGKGAGYREAGLQVMTYRVFATGYMPIKPVLPDVATTTSERIEPKSYRRALLDIAVGWEQTAVYDYGSLNAGDRVAAPAIIEAPTTTVVVPPGTSATVDRLGNLVLRSR